MNTLKGFKDFHKVIRPLIMKQNHCPGHTIPSIWVRLFTWEQIVASDYCGIFEITNRKINKHGRKDDSTTSMLSRIEEKLPCDVFIRIRKHNKPLFVVVKLLGWCLDPDGKPIIQIEHSERFCYTTPVAGSMGDKKPEQQ